MGKKSKFKQKEESSQEESQREENSDECKPKKRKSIKQIKKHKSKKKRLKQKEQSEVKDEDEEPEKKPKKKKVKSKSKSKKKHKEKEESQEIVKSQDESKEQSQEQQQRLKKTPKKKKRNTLINKEGQDKLEAIDVQQLKFQQQISQPLQGRSSRSTVKKKGVVSLEDSQRIIYQFSLDAGDYKGLKNELPHVGQKNIRNHLTKLFEYCLDQITERVKSLGRKIRDWQPVQRREIIRELHRIRSSNRLLSEGNVDLRDTFHKMMQTYNHPEILMTDHELSFLFKRIEAFARGFNQTNSFRKSHYVAPDQQDFRRKPIVEGGYIMQKKTMREQKKTISKSFPMTVNIDSEKVIQEWTEAEDKEICKLYLDDINIEFIIENLKAKFGENDKWGDFEIVGKKTDNLIKLGLIRLEELTLTPYNRLERMMQDQEKSKRSEDQRKKLKTERLNRLAPTRIEDFREMVYYSKQPSRLGKESCLIKNPSLLLRQVFAHHGQSSKVRHALVQLLVDRYPQESKMEYTLQVIKEFTEWASREEDTNHVTLVRARLPVIEGTKSRAPTLAESDSERSTNSIKRETKRDAEEVAEGLSLLQDLQDSGEDAPKEEERDEDKLKIDYFHKNEFDFDERVKNHQKTNLTNKSHGELTHKTLSLSRPIAKATTEQEVKREQSIIQIFESQQSEYEGFISTHPLQTRK